MGQIKAKFTVNLPNILMKIASHFKDHSLYIKHEQADQNRLKINVFLTCLAKYSHFLPNPALIMDYVHLLITINDVIINNLE